MKTLSAVIAVPLTVVAYNITMKMDSRNIDQLINAVVIAVVILAVIVPVGLYVLAYIRHRVEMERMDTRRSAPRMNGPLSIDAVPAGWNSNPPPLLTAQPTQPVGTFAVQPSMYEVQQEDWS